MGRSGLSITLTSNLWVSLNNNVVTQVFSNFSWIKFLVSHPLIHYAFILSGTDYLSVAAFTDATAAHLVFLKGRVRIFFFGRLTCHFVTQTLPSSLYTEKNQQSKKEVFIFLVILVKYFQDIILVEALKLEDVEAGIYSVHCLPLRLVGAEGSPIRCILIK